MIKNVLVFPCGSEIGLEVHRSLAYSTHVVLYGGSSVSDHGEFVFENYIPDLPSVHDENFIDEINIVINKYNIDYIIPAHDDVVLRLAEARADNLIDSEVVSSPLETCQIARYKSKTYEALQDVIETPRVFQPSDIQKADLPVFLKPDRGQGSKGAQKAETLEDVQYLRGKNPDLIILEYLPGKEYTVDCFTDSNGTLQFCEARERSRIQNGISVSSKTYVDSKINSMAESINQKLHFRGVWFFQVKQRKNGDFVLMEVAPRIAGTMGLVRAKGVNMVLLSIFDLWGFATRIHELSSNVVIDRALQNRYISDVKYSKVYLDFDDFIVLRGKINPVVMAFMFQCINKGITLHLITRHKMNIHETLKKYRLTDIFDEIIHITDRAIGKDRYIPHQDAIFLDDSFSERMSIADKCGIPTYDAHMLESLMTKD